MKKAYDRTRALELVPLLAAITREIAERSYQIEMLEQRLGILERRPGLDPTESERLRLRAELATQLREVRLARTELERLGCVVDESRPDRVFIPGLDGNLERGFRWDVGDGFIHSVTNTSVG